MRRASARPLRFPREFHDRACSEGDGDGELFVRERQKARLEDDRVRQGKPEADESGPSVRWMGNVYLVAIAFVISLFNASSFFFNSSGGESSISS